jgi:hypothetical protein
VPEQARITGSTAVTRPLAGRLTERPWSVSLLVDVGLAVGDDDHLLAAQLGLQQLAQAGRRPAVVALGLAQPVLQVAQAGAQFLHERGEFGRGPRHRLQRALATQQGAGARQPAPQAELRDHHRDERHHQAEHGDERHQVALRVARAQPPVAGVLQDHQRDLVAVGQRDVVEAQVDRAPFDFQPRIGLLGRLLQLVAGQAIGKGGGATHRDAVRPAQRQADEALVAQRPFEHRAQLVAARLVQPFVDGVGQGRGDERAADVEVAREPARGELLEQAGGQVGRADHDQHERQQEAQLETQAGHRRMVMDGWGSGSGAKKGPPVPGGRPDEAGSGLIP